MRDEKKREMTSTSKHVLVVDDDPDLAESLASLVAGLGHTTQIASSPRAAWKIVRDEGGVDVLLLDVNLDEQEAWRLADDVRREATPLETMIVAMSGDARGPVRARAFAAGCDAFLGKPVVISVLAAIISCAGMDPARPEQAPVAAEEPDDRVDPPRAGRSR